VRRAFYALPFVAFALLAIVFYVNLNGAAPDQLPSAMIGKPVPGIALPPLDADAQGFTPRDLASGHVSVVNVWASWCAPCKLEAPTLAELGARRDIVLYGLVYKDKPAAARGFLHELGNPFARIGLDGSGATAIEWGVYGVPETYVIDGRGIIRERFAGQLTPDVMARIIEPAIQRARSGVD
jgi:cytochrome c biogenesis protein CcmG/thiol:disulfide interchange protein DsbE